MKTASLYHALFARAPMLLVALGVVSGILLDNHASCPPMLWCCLIALAALAIMGAAMCWDALRLCFHPSMWLLFITMGVILSQLHAPIDPFPSLEQIPTNHLSLVVKEAPQPTSRCYKVEVELDSIGRITRKGKLLLFLPKESVAAALLPSDKLYVDASLHRPSGEENPYQFDYQKYLRHKGIFWICHADSKSWRLVAASKAKFSPALWQRRLVTQLQSSSLSPRQLGIAEALLLGWRKDVDPQTQQLFRNAGITHLLCVSGLHVGVLAMLVGGYLFFIGRLRWQRIVKGTVQLIVIWGYVMLTGMAPSTMRAGVMFSLLIIGKILQQNSSSLNHLATSAVILLCIHPGSLFDVGFQLSYSAVLGIIAFYQPMRHLIPSLVRMELPLALRLPAKVWSWTCLSTAAQLGTLPLVLHYFHQFPTYFLIANLTIVPFAGVLLATAILLIVSGGCAWITGVMAAEFTFVENLTQWVSSLPGALVTDIYLDTPMTILLASTLLLLVVLIRQRRMWTLPAAIGCLILMTLHLAIIDNKALKQSDIVVYHTGSHLAIECFNGRESYLICDSLTARQPSLIDFQRQGMIHHRRILNSKILPIDTMFTDNCCAVQHHGISFGGRRLLVVDRDNARPFHPYSSSTPKAVPLHLDALVVAPHTWVDTARLASTFNADTILYHYRYTLIPQQKEKE